MLCDLVTKSNGFFKDLTRSGCITEKELKYFSYEYKKDHQHRKVIPICENP